MMAIRSDMTLRGELRIDEPMAKHTTWRVGGPAKQFFIPADAQDLALFLQQGNYRLPLVWLGLGSNLLVRDGGINGTVISTQGGLSNITRTSEQQVRVEVGVTCAKISRYCVKHHLSGLEFLIGIPGSVGGALAMNAGAFGGATWDRVVEVEMMDLNGTIRKYRPEHFEIAYRNVSGPAEQWFIAAHFRLQVGNAQRGGEQIRALLDKRGTAQPIGTANCGSVFRNPAGTHAAKLIETAHLKGCCIGGACVSEKHANFIINSGQASARDIEALIAKVQSEVAAAHGIELQTEVVIVGEYE